MRNKFNPKRLGSIALALAAMAPTVLVGAPASASVVTYEVLEIFEVSFKVCKEVTVSPGVKATVCQNVTV